MKSKSNPVRLVGLKSALSAGALLVLLMATGGTGHAGAWVPFQGDLSLGLNYQYDQSSGLYYDGELQSDTADTRVQRLALSAEYVPISNLAVRANVPLMLVQYHGEGGGALLQHGAWDDRNTHATMQDLRLDARYQVLEQPIFALSPLVGVSIPMSDYETIGFTAAGRGVRKLHLGLSAARTLDPYVPNLYLHASYEFSLAESVDLSEETAEFSQHHSNYDVQLGYFVLPELNLFGRLQGAHHHDGISYVDWGDHSSDLKNFHDPILQERTLLWGVGAGYRLTNSVSTTASYSRFITGDNTRNAQIFALGISWRHPVGPFDDDF